MKQKLKRLISVAIAIAMVMAVLNVQGPLKSEADDVDKKNTIEMNFEELLASYTDGYAFSNQGTNNPRIIGELGFTGTIRSDKKSGMWRLKKNHSVFLGGKTGAAAWSDYTYETTFQIKSGADSSGIDPATSTTAENAGITCGYSDYDGNGRARYLQWEITDYNPTDGKWTASFKRILNASVQSSYTKTFEVTGLSIDSDIRLKMELDGNVCRCYVNDKLYYTFTDPSVSIITGTVGLIRGNVDMYVKSMKVSDIAFAYDYKTILSHYTAGATVASADVSATLLESLGFGTTQTSGDDMTTMRAVRGEDADPVLKVKSDAGYLETLNPSTYPSAKWSNYTYEATMKLTGETDSGVNLNDSEQDINTGLAIAVQSKSNGNSGTAVDKELRWQIHNIGNGQEWVLQLDVRSDGSSIKTHEVTVPGLGFNKYITLKVVLKNNTAYCYVGNTLYYTYQDTSVEKLEGTVGYTVGGVTYIKSMKVYATDMAKDYTLDRPAAITEMAESDFANIADNGNAFTAADGWNVDSITSNAIVTNGVAYANSASTNYYVCVGEEFRDGYVEADLSIPTGGKNTADTRPQMKSASSTLQARYDSNTGYGIQASLVAFKDEAKGAGNYTGTYSGLLKMTMKWGSTNQEKKEVEIAIPNFAFDRNYKVKLLTVGNYVEASVDGIVVYQSTLDANGYLVGRLGEYGVSKPAGNINGSFDNVKVVKYNANKAAMDAESAELASLDTFVAVETGTKYSRTTFYKDETVLITVKSKRNWEVDEEATKYTTGTGTTAITDKDGTWVYKFQMPQEDAVISVGLKKSALQAINQIAYSNFDEFVNNTDAFTAAEGWDVIGKNMKVQDGVAITQSPSESYYAYAGDSFRDGYVQADLTVTGKATSDSRTQRKSGSSTLTARYDSDTGYGIQASLVAFKDEAKGDDDYTGTYSGLLRMTIKWGDDATEKKEVEVSLSDFDFGKTYNVKLLTVGNYVETRVDDVIVYQCTLNDGGALVNASGEYGVFKPAGNIDGTFDNVEAVMFNAKTASLDQASSDLATLVSYQSAETGKKNTRTTFYKGELVVITVDKKDGYCVDEDAMKYKTEKGTTAITDKDGAWVYGFKMPEYDAIISVGLKESADASGQDAGIMFQDNFSEDTTMTERGWNQNADIISGGAFLKNTEKLYLESPDNVNNWKDYVVEADVKAIDMNAERSGSIVALGMRCTDGTGGYHFRLCATWADNAGAFAVYDAMAEKEILKTDARDVNAGQTYHVAMVVQENQILCYVDGEHVLTTTADTSARGSIFFTSLNGTALIDNVVVRTVDSFYAAYGLDDSVISSPGILGGLSPSTWDENPIVPMIILCTVSLAVLFAGKVYYKRRKEE